MRYLAVLGRLWKISLAELESFYSDVRLMPTGDVGKTRLDIKQNQTAIFTAESEPDFRRFGGILKFGVEIPGGEKGIVDYLNSLPEGKIVLGVSDFRKSNSKFAAKIASDEALKLKRILRSSGRSVRVLENRAAILSTATSHHNQLAEKKNHVEIMLTKFGNFRLSYVQNITKYTERDQARPARDAKVGMLPPKLAQILINLLGPLPSGSVILDPFCGTGVVLQEAVLDGYRALGSDLNPRMIEYSKRNLEWLRTRKSFTWIRDVNFWTEVGDAMNFDWKSSRGLNDFGGKIGGVAAEVFLGSPMSREPVGIKLREEKERCCMILKGFLRNLHSQIESGTGIVLAIPAWRRENGKYERLGILDDIEEMGYNLKKFRNLRQEDLLYYREGQIVAREIIVLRKK